MSDQRPDPKTPAVPNSPKARQAARREQRLAEIADLVSNGRLVVRTMTAAELAANQPRRR